MKDKQPPSMPCPKCKGSGRVSNPEHLAARLAAARAKAGISLRTLGKQLDYSPMFCSDVEHGRRSPRPEMVEAWLKACGEVTP